MSRGVALALATVLVGPAGCEEDADGLDSQEIRDLARTPGSARGYAATGLYTGRLRASQCDCPSLVTKFDELVPTCEPEVTGTERIVALELIQADGVAVLRGLEVPLTGGLDEDGTLSLGAVIDISSIVVELESLGLLQGTLDLEHTPARLDATLRTRAHGTLPLSEPEQLDCGSRFELELRRL